MLQIETARNLRLMIAVILLPAVVSGLASAQATLPPCEDHPVEAPARSSLEAVIHEACLTPPANAIVALDQKITSYAVLNDSEDYILGYYVLSQDGLLTPPLHLLRYQKASHTWSHKEIAKTAPPAASSKDINSEYEPCFGSVLSIVRAGGFFYIETHINPSASCTLVFSSDLTLRDNLYGWVVASFSSGTVVFQESVVHFAPTHPMRLALYDPHHKTTTQIYPSRHDKLLTAYVRRLQKISAGQRCQGENCYSDPNPDLIDASLGAMPGDTSKLAIAVNENTHTLAFLAVYSPRGFLPLHEINSPKWSEQVVYVYRLSGGISYREFPLSAMQERYGSTTLDHLLKPEVTARMFSAATASR